MPYPAPRKGVLRSLALIALAAAYFGWLYTRWALVESRLDGTVGVLLGLFICAHPAANAIDLLFAPRHSAGRTRWRSALSWLALNFVVLLIGWAVITMGASRLTARKHVGVDDTENPPSTLLQGIRGQTPNAFNS